MSKHARLAASQSYRWITCPGSISMLENFYDIVPPTDSEYAQEGTHAHEILSKQLEFIYLNGKENPILEKDQWALDATHDYVMEQMEFKSNPKIYVEKYVIPYDERDDMGGTADIIILSDTEVEIIDYKHGRGVYVPVKDNTQLIIYALGVLNKMETLHGKKMIKKYCRNQYGDSWIETTHQQTPLKVRITIAQPRHGQAREESPKGDGIMSQVYSLHQMNQFKAEILKACGRVDEVDVMFKRPTFTFQKAYEQGYISPGDPKLKKQGKDPCRFCELKTMCPATHDAAQSAKRAASEFADVDDELSSLERISEEEVQKMIERLVWFYEETKSFKSIAASAEAMLMQVLSNTQLEDFVLDYGLQNKYGNRAWTKDDKIIVARMMKDYGLTKMQCYQVKLKSPAQMEENLNSSQKRMMKDEALISNPYTGHKLQFIGNK